MLACACHRTTAMVRKFSSESYLPPQTRPPDLVHRPRLHNPRHNPRVVNRPQPTRSRRHVARQNQWPAYATLQDFPQRVHRCRRWVSQANLVNHHQRPAFDIPPPSLRRPSHQPRRFAPSIFRSFAWDLLEQLFRKNDLEVSPAKFAESPKLRTGNLVAQAQTAHRFAHAWP